MIGLAWSVNAIYVPFWRKHMSVNFILSIRPRIWPVLYFETVFIIFYFCLSLLSLFVVNCIYTYFSLFFNPRINKVIINKVIIIITTYQKSYSRKLEARNRFRCRNACAKIRKWRKNKCLNKTYVYRKLDKT